MNEIPMAMFAVALIANPVMAWRGVASGSGQEHPRQLQQVLSELPFQLGISQLPVDGKIRASPTILLLN